MIKIYHNPRCRKSREGLQILQESGKNFEIIDCLKEELSFDEVKYKLLSKWKKSVLLILEL